MSDTPQSDRLWEIEDRYRARFEAETLTYGTVRDFADSRDHMPRLARSQGDMKDLQRSWMVKAILGAVAPGSRLIEIGAGDPLAADLLSRLDYRVTVVDPYDGSGGGPLEFEEVRRAYPHLDFIRERFPSAAALPEDPAAVYSISVLEHIPLERVGAVVEASMDALAPGGICVHAVDHVVAGWGANQHLERLEEIVRRSGIPLAHLHELLRRLESDPETYFVSAEAHERWRGALPYEHYPMRRITSIGVLSRRR